MSNDINEFEKLLKAKTSSDQQTVVTSIDDVKVERLVANKSASLDDFIEMLAKIVCKVMKQKNIEFKPDEGARISVDQAEKLDHPYVFYKIVQSKPSMEIKPRIRETSLKGIDGQQNERRRSGEIWGQVFNSIIQFDIFASDYKEATEVMNNFEDVIFTYTAYFMRNGVKSIRFSQRLTDKNLDIYRQKCSIRTLQYDISIEKLITRMDTEIEGFHVR